METKENNPVSYERRLCRLRENILQAASRQIVKYGFRKFTIDDIASELSISKKTIYKYFNSKNSLIGAVIDYHMKIASDDVKNIINSKRSWLEKLQDIFFGHLPEYDPERLLELLRELKACFPEEWKKTERVKKVKREHVKKLIFTGLQNGDVNPDMNPAVIMLMFERTMDAIFEERFLKENDITPRQAMESVKHTLLYGIIKR